MSSTRSKSRKTGASALLRDSHLAPTVRSSTARTERSSRRASTPVLRDLEVRQFRQVVWEYWKKNHRDLPWRRTHDPYKIMVSEVMLQQTQVPRVIEKYQEFLEEFPTVERLAKARLAQVLRVWSGLGYNRRAKYLHEAAKRVVRDYGGRVPKTAAELEQLPGIGKYTARAIIAFAYNTPSVFIETNIRAVFIHHFFPKTSKVHDSELLPIIETAAEGQLPREWYAALMDYGSYLKRTEGNASRQSVHHVRQEKFKGSSREARGLVLKALKDGSLTEVELRKAIKLDSERLIKALDDLKADGMIRKARTRWVVAG